MKKNMLIISYSHLERDSRVYRQIEVFKDKYDVTTIGYSSSRIEGVQHYTSYSKNINVLKRIRYRRIKKILLKRKQYEKLYWSNPLIKDSYKKLKNLKFDIIIANDINTLPLALKIKGEAKLLFDAHEYFPRHYEHNKNWVNYYKPYNYYLCDRYMSKADKVITVGRGIAEEYSRQFNIEKPEVITNAVEYQELMASEVNEESIHIIHHGSAHPARKIEKMIEIMDHVDSRYKLDLMLVPTSKSYYEKLKVMANERDNVRLISPVPMRRIVRKINSYDIGISIFPPTTFNLENALPNKFFEFIQARLMILIGPSKEMMNFVYDYELGIVSNSFEPRDVATELNKLKISDIKRFKDNSHKASTKLNANTNVNKLIKITNVLLENV